VLSSALSLLLLLLLLPGSILRIDGRLFSMPLLFGMLGLGILGICDVKGAGRRIPEVQRAYDEV
jgi:hypothetical protein